MLYIVPTPIGNLEDMTLRGLRILKEVDLVLAEDTRNSAKLLKHYDIDTPLKAYHAFNEHKVTDQIVDILNAGSTIAIITDAGTPGISDPGFLLVRACVEAKVPLTCLPGATSFVPALVASGLPSDKFFFEGFLPHKKGRKTRLEFLADLPYTFVLFESPHRLVKTLDQLITHCGEDRRACVAREISKVFESIRTAPLPMLKSQYDSGKVKGEIVIVVEGKKG